MQPLRRTRAAALAVAAVALCAAAPAHGVATPAVPCNASYPLCWAEGVSCPSRDECVQTCPPGSAPNVTTTRLVGGLWSNFAVGDPNNCVGPCVDLTRTKVHGGYWECQGGSTRLSSVCRVKCYDYYQPRHGYWAPDGPLYCNNNTAYRGWSWDPSDYYCYKPSEAAREACYTPTLSPGDPGMHTDWSCDKGNLAGSTCKLSCGPGQVAVGPVNETTCKSNYDFPLSDPRYGAWGWWPTPTASRCVTRSQCAAPETSNFFYSGPTLSTCRYPNGTRAEGPEYEAGVVCNTQCVAFHLIVPSDDDGGNDVSDYTPSAASTRCTVDGVWDPPFSQQGYPWLTGNAMGGAVGESGEDGGGGGGGGDSDAITCIKPKVCKWALGGEESGSRAANGYSVPGEGPEGSITFGVLPLAGIVGGVLAVGVVLEFAFHSMHHASHGHMRAAALLAAFRHELSVVGLLAFIVYLVSSACWMAHDDDAGAVKEVLELIHMLLFFVIVVYFALFVFSFVPLRGLTRILRAYEKRLRLANIEIHRKKLQVEAAEAAKKAGAAAAAAAGAVGDAKAAAPSPPASSATPAAAGAARASDLQIKHTATGRALAAARVAAAAAAQDNAASAPSRNRRVNYCIGFCEGFTHGLFMSVYKLKYMQYVALCKHCIFTHGLPLTFNLGRYLRTAAYFKMTQALEQSWQAFAAMLLAVFPFAYGKDVAFWGLLVMLGLFLLLRAALAAWVRGLFKPVQLQHNRGRGFTLPMFRGNPKAPADAPERPTTLSAAQIRDICERSKARHPQLLRWMRVMTLLTQWYLVTFSLASTYVLVFVGSEMFEGASSNAVAFIYFVLYFFVLSCGCVDMLVSTSLIEACYSVLQPEPLLMVYGHPVEEEHGHGHGHGDGDEHDDGGDAGHADANAHGQGQGHGHGDAKDAPLLAHAAGGAAVAGHGRHGTAAAAAAAATAAAASPGRTHAPPMRRGGSARTNNGADSSDDEEGDMPPMPLGEGGEEAAVAAGGGGGGGGTPLGFAGPSPHLPDARYGMGPPAPAPAPAPAAAAAPAGAATVTVPLPVPVPVPVRADGLGGGGRSGSVRGVELRNSVEHETGTGTTGPLGSLE